MKKWISNLRIKFKIYLIMAISLISLIFLGAISNYFYNTGKLMTIFIDGMRMHSDRYNLSIQDFFLYLNTNDQKYLDNCFQELEKNNAMPYIFGQVEKHAKANNSEELADIVIGVLDGSLHTKSNAKLLVSRLRILLPLKIPQFQKVIKSTWHGYLCGINVKKEIENYLANPSPEIFDKLNNAMQEMNSYYTDYADAIHNIQSLTNKVLKVGFVIIVLLFCVIVFASLLSISKAITEPISELVTNMNEVAIGDLSGEINIDTRDELGQLTASFNRMKQDMQQTITHAHKIADGDYSNVIDPKSEEDELSISLNRMTKALHDGREYRTAIFNSIQAGVILINAESMEIEYVNPVASEMIGAREETIIGNICYNYICHKQSEGCPITNPSLKVDGCESILIKENGEKISILKSVRTISVNDREIIMETFLDITDRKIAEQKKTEALNQLRVANEELEEYTCQLKKSQVTLKEQQEELQVTNEELEEKTESLESQKFEIENQNRELEAARKDIENKADQLELASKYKSEFLANMSHELRTPLNSVLILSRDLADNNKANLEDRQVESAKIIYKCGTDLLNLINEILDLSKIEAGKVSLLIENVSLNDIAHNITWNFQHQIEKKKLKLEVNTSPDLPKQVQTDQQRLEQIIKNLLSNAIKFTSDGRVTVNFHRPGSNTKFSSSVLNRKKTIAISVSDTGIGIPVEKQTAIFEAFQQADGSTSRKYGGTGLGLSISLELAKLLGGELQLQSKEGVGSTFTIYVPEILDNKNPEIKLEQLPNELTENEEYKIVSTYIKDCNEILIVEDDENMQKIISDLISSSDVKVTATNTGKDALQQLKNKKFDCVILDLNLPDISGFDLLKKIKKIHDETIPPILVYTGRHITKQEEFELKKFATSVIIKGVRSEDRLLDETALFLHQVVEKMPEEKQKIISMLHDKNGHFRDKNILLVDDDVRNIFAVSKILEDREANVFSAVNGEKALEILQEKPEMDLVLMDIMMPVLDGYETMKRLRAQQQFSNLPIIALTAKAMKEDRKKCIDAGANDYISKPLDVSKLLSLMRIWLYN